MTDLGNACKIALQGALDTLGVDQIETRFTASIVSSGKHALVDLSGVIFLIDGHPHAGRHCTRADSGRAR